MRKLFVIILFLFNLQSNVYSNDVKSIIEGNNNAQIKLIIYESLTCSHCADFHLDVYPLLKKEFLETGLASIEFRNFPLDLAALNASKLAHCKNDGNSEILHYLYTNQKFWIKGNNILELNSNLKNLIEKNNFDLDFKKCLNNKEIEDHILEERINGQKKFKIDATPTLIINGKKFEKPIKYNNLKKLLKKMI